MILFLQATKHLKDKGFNIEYLYAADIREHKPDWTHPSFLVDWLLDSDFHGLFCQGIHNQMFGIWKPIDCIEEIKRLEFHNGYPSGSHLRDPVFNGDKFGYLCAASEYCNPSFKIPLNYSLSGELHIQEILSAAHKFMDTFSTYDGESQKGFILKAPFVQNKLGFPVFYFTTYEQLVARIHNCYVKESSNFGKLHLRDADVFPYLIIQPRMVSSNESKVILWNGKAQYVCTNGGKRGILGKTTKPKLFTFVEEAWTALNTETNGAFLGDGLSRVDCFCTEDGKIVVNEFESIDANFSGTRSYESMTTSFLADYYKRIIDTKLISLYF